MSDLERNDAGAVEPDRDRRRQIAWRAFEGHARVYGLVNLFLVVLWLVTGAGYFWPIWPILGWGLGLGFQAVATFGSRGRGQ